MANQKEGKLTWQEIEEKKINMVKERGSRVMKINSPLGSTLFDILRQFDMAYAHFKSRLGEMGGISYQEGEELMDEGRRIVMDFSDFTEKLCKRVRFRYFTPREISEFLKALDIAGSEESCGTDNILVSERADHASLETSTNTKEKV